MLKKLDQLVKFCESHQCRRQLVLSYFNEDHPGNCNSCDTCLRDYQKIDGTIIAQKALSAVLRLDQRFGANYVIDFLRGSQSAKIRDWHKTIKTYGVGADISKEKWRQYIHDLIEMRYLNQTGASYPVLALTDKSWDVLNGNQSVVFLEADEPEDRPESTQLPHEEELFTILKKIRYDLAQQENVPAYVVFSDATLLELATYLPHTTNDLGKISGFGEIKIKKYGPEFLEAVLEYCNTNQLDSRIDTLTRHRRRRHKTPSPNPSDTKLESLQLFNSGKTIAEIANIRGFQPRTIEEHLAHFILDGQIEINQLVPEDKIPLITEAMNLHGADKLKPIKDTLGEQVSYGEIKAVINHLQRTGETPDPS